MTTAELIERNRILERLRFHGDWEWKRSLDQLAKAQALLWHRTPLKERQSILKELEGKQ